MFHTVLKVFGIEIESEKTWVTVLDSALDTRAVRKFPVDSKEQEWNKIRNFQVNIHWDIHNDQFRQCRHRFVSSCEAHHRGRIYWSNWVGREGGVLL
jgi:hypothetical protein